MPALSPLSGANGSAAGSLGGAQASAPARRRRGTNRGALQPNGFCTRRPPSVAALRELMPPVPIELHIWRANAVGTRVAEILAVARLAAHLLYSARAGSHYAPTPREHALLLPLRSELAHTESSLKPLGYGRRTGGRGRRQDAARPRARRHSACGQRRRATAPPPILWNSSLGPQAMQRPQAPLSIALQTDALALRPYTAAAPTTYDASRGRRSPSDGLTGTAVDGWGGTTSMLTKGSATNGGRNATRAKGSGKRSDRSGREQKSVGDQEERHGKQHADTHNDGSRNEGQKR